MGNGCKIKKRYVCSNAAECEHIEETTFSNCLNRHCGECTSVDARANADYQYEIEQNKKQNTYYRALAIACSFDDDMIAGFVERAEQGVEYMKNDIKTKLAVLKLAQAHQIEMIEKGILSSIIFFKCTLFFV